MTRPRAAAAVAIQINAAILVLACCLGGSPAWAIDCMSAAGDPKTGWYSWRLIDGRKCWFLKTGAMPAKSQLRWPEKTEPVKPDTETQTAAEPTVAAEERDASESAAVTPPPAETADAPQPRTASQLRFRTARVRPVAAPLVHLGHGLDLMNGASLTANTPPSLAPADPFHARFTAGAIDQPASSRHHHGR